MPSFIIYFSGMKSITTVQLALFSGWFLYRNKQNSFDGYVMDFYTGQLLLVVRVRRCSYHIMLIVLFPCLPVYFPLVFLPKIHTEAVMEQMGGNTAETSKLLSPLKKLRLMHYLIAVIEQKSTREYMQVYLLGSSSQFLSKIIQMK